MEELHPIQPIFEGDSSIILYNGSTDGGYALFDAGMHQFSSYDFAKPPQPSAGTGLTWVQTQGKWGFIDREGRVRIAFDYDEARSFHEGQAAVSTGGKWGFIDPTGRLVIAACYDSVSDFNSGLALFVNRETERGYLDRDGRSSSISCASGPPISARQATRSASLAPRRPAHGIPGSGAVLPRPGAGVPQLPAPGLYQCPGRRGDFLATTATPNPSPGTTRGRSFAAVNCC